LNLFHKEVGELKVHLHACLLDSIIQDVVVGTRQSDSGKEIGCDAMEQRQVRVQELWQVDVHDGTQHQHVFVFIRIFQLKTHLAFYMTVLYTPPLLHPFNSLFSRTTWASRYQKGKTSLDLNEARDDGVLG